MDIDELLNQINQLKAQIVRAEAGCIKRKEYITKDNLRVAIENLGLIEARLNSFSIARSPIEQGE